LRQQDYTKKTQALAKERQELEQWKTQREEAQKFEDNYQIDIDHVLKDPTKEQQFKSIYPPKYHAMLDQALNKTFGDPNTAKRNETILEARLRSVEGNFQRLEQEKAQVAFESEVSKNSEILGSAISRLSTKYPMADEDSVLARAEYMANGLKKDASFNDEFGKVMEKLYKENHDFHTKRYQQTYKEKIEKQKDANARGRGAGKGGETPGAAPEKLKLRDVKNHILNQMGQT
jgi:hypothetical protein